MRQLCIVGDLTKDERNDYFNKLFSIYVDSRVGELVKIVGKDIGCRLLDLYNLRSELFSMDPKIARSPQVFTEMVGEGVCTK